MRSDKARHYRATRWVDFVRGAVSGTGYRRMQAHLDTGCNKCRELTDFYTEVAIRAAADCEYRLPRAAVQRAVKIFSQREAYHLAYQVRRRRLAA